MNKLTAIKKIKLTYLGVLLILLFSSVNIGIAQENRLDLTDILKDTQKMSKKEDELTIVWWIPEEYWLASFSQDPRVTKEQAEEFVEILRPYILISVVDGRIGLFGGITYRSEADIGADINVRDSKEIRYRPLSENKIDADTKNFLLMIRPVLAESIGAMGENMHFFVFSAKDKKGNKIVDPKKDGKFVVELGKREFNWRLPLGSVIPPKICPTCGEGLSGAYKFCPWDGTRLLKQLNFTPPSGLH